jgi:probable rRNA maturation factor
MASINFFTEDVTFKVPNPRKTSAWLKSAIAKEKRSLSQLNYIFCSDTYLNRINQQYLNHTSLTDIITFDNSDGSGVIEGDIFISIDRIDENAIKFKTNFQTELLRVIVHGALHLIGYTDKTAKAKVEMRKKEDAYLSLFHK